MELNRAKNEMEAMKRKIKKLEDTKNTVTKMLSEYISSKILLIKFNS